MQIPVEGGHKGGRLNVDHHQKTEMVDLTHNSHQNFYISVMHVDSVREMEPILSGNRVELVFHLLWKSPSVALYPPLPDISNFLVALTKLKIDLKSWLEQEGATKMLIIGLEHNYDPNCHSFATLQGQDRSVAHLIRSAALVDVHLALLTRHVTDSHSRSSKLEGEVKACHGVKVNKKNGIVNDVHRTVHTVSHWMGIDNCAAQFQELDIDANSQFVGDVFKPDAKPARKESRANLDFSGTNLNLWYHQSVLIIWPKSKSMYFDLRYRFEHVLDRMECEQKTEALALLRMIISECSVWTITELRICRLLHICLRFQARSEALKLLQIMVDNSIGIPNGNAANLIAELECRLLGWNECRGYIDALIATAPVEQMGHIATLSLAFLDRNALAGFVFVSQQNWKNFLLHSEKEKTINHYTSATCILMMIWMEERPETRNPNRIDEFVSYFIQWDILQQCQLVIDIKETSRKSSAGRILFLRLCQELVSAIDPTSNALENCILDLFNCLMLDPHLRCVFELLVEKLCRPPPATAENHLLDKIVSSFQAVDLSNDIVLQLIDARIAELTSLSRPEFSWEFKDANFLGKDDFPEVLEFLQSPERLLVMRHFNCLQDARKFVNTYFGVMDTCVQSGYSAMARYTGTGKATRCRIVKSRNLFLAKTAKYEAQMVEFDRLLKLRNFIGLQPTEDVLPDLENNEEESRKRSDDGGADQDAPVPKKKRVTKKKPLKRK